MLERFSALPVVLAGLTVRAVAAVAFSLHVCWQEGGPCLQTWLGVG